jgi:aspartyl-tRNA(Asn)/glutamyl-tRNA(Gln) amidotransferase subunit C
VHSQWSGSKDGSFEAILGGGGQEIVTARMTGDEVRKLARLARLELSAEEIAHLTPQLEAILGFVQHLSELDTSGIEPMTTALDVVNRWAEDDIGTSLAVDAALANAPRHDDACFLVPPVLGPVER